jgi:hypothetical protein
MVIHHINHDSLDDRIENLQLLSKAAHLAAHIDDYRPEILAKLHALRRERRWSTKSVTKQNGRPTTWTKDEMKAAVADYLSGGGTYAQVGLKFGIPGPTLGNHVRAERQ